MPTRNREHPRPYHVAVAVPDTPAIAIVRNVPAEHRGETEPLFNLALATLTDTVAHARSAHGDWTDAGHDLTLG
jgi:hypothetical protein